MTYDPLCKGVGTFASACKGAGVASDKVERAIEEWASAREGSAPVEALRRIAGTIVCYCGTVQTSMEPTAKARYDAALAEHRAGKRSSAPQQSVYGPPLQNVVSDVLEPVNESLQDVGDAITWWVSGSESGANDLDRLFACLSRAGVGDSVNPRGRSGRGLGARYRIRPTTQALMVPALGSRLVWAVPKEEDDRAAKRTKLLAALEALD